MKFVSNRVFLVFTATIAAAATGATTATAADTTLVGENVVDYSRGADLGLYHQFDLEESEFVVLQGSALDGGCAFDVELPVSEAAIAAVEQQYDPDTCQMLLEIGRPSDADLALHAGDYLLTVRGDTVGGHQQEWVGTEVADTTALLTHPRRKLRHWISSMWEEPARYISCDPELAIYSPNLCGVTKQNVAPTSHVKNFAEGTPTANCAHNGDGRVGWWEDWLDNNFTQWKKTQLIRSVDPFSCTKMFSSTKLELKNFTFCKDFVQPVTAWLSDHLDEIGIELEPQPENPAPTIARYWPSYVEGAQAESSHQREGYEVGTGS